MSRKILWILLFLSIIFNFYCASTNKREISFAYWQVSSRLFDLETRGESTDELSKELNRCRTLVESRDYSRAKECLNMLIQAVNERYRKEFPQEYIYENIQFTDIFIETSMGRKAGFIAQPAAEGKYPGLIFLRGAGGSAIDLKRAIYGYAKKDYICMAPEFNDDISLKGLVDLKKWYEVFKSFPKLDLKRVGIISYSRGGLYAYKLIENGIPFQAWVNYFGVVYSTVSDGEIIRRNPVPVLILHGRKDRVCPVKWAFDLEKAYQEAGVEYEIKIFDEEGHGFRQEAMNEARNLTLKFLGRYLKGKDKS